MAKFNDVTAGQTEACINRMGGWGNFLRFIGGQGEIVFKTILLLITSIVVPAQSRFVARDHFIVDTGKTAKVKIAFVGNDFRNWFIDKIEDPTTETELAFHKLEENSRDDRILAELGDRQETTLSQFCALLAEQASGEEGALLTNGWANIFYIRDAKSILRAVIAYWLADRGGWDVRARSVVHVYEWHAGHQVVSRKQV